jgi:hypothetical protein
MRKFIFELFEFSCKKETDGVSTEYNIEIGAGWFFVIGILLLSLIL